MAGPNRGMPATHCYTQADLRPTLKDPRCNPNFPLAAYWPVYLGNFWCDVYTQRTERIQEYFGSKGLLVRMVFSRSGACDPFLKEQKRCQCYDFLVYFVSQQDAHDAVYYCNRDMYYGHRLNVLPGRIPAPFDVSKSAKHTFWQHERLKLEEQVFERYVNDEVGAQISCIVRHTTEDVLVEYASVNDRNKVIRSCQIALPGPISAFQAKQRFLEQNVEMEIMMWMQENPGFMNMLSPNNVLQALFKGVLPNVNQSWKTVVKLPPAMKLKVKGTKERRLFLNRRICNQAMNHFGVLCDFVHVVSGEVLEARVQRRQAKKDAKKEKRLKMQARQ
ncbi:uncharacterized protein LOC109420815 isoform X2 [Aedes albopictus]|uniref:RRM domain-containing protein n=1 Tax=Aedes albopictus TaxID=7160 RepID=A0ABM1XPR8_AEDAL